MFFNNVFQWSGRLNVELTLFIANSSVHMARTVWVCAYMILLTTSCWLASEQKYVGGSFPFSQVLCPLLHLNCHIIILLIIGIISIKRDLTNAFSSFQIIWNSKRYLGPLQLISYALEIGLSIIKLQWPAFVIMRIFQLHASTLIKVWNILLNDWLVH